MAFQRQSIYAPLQAHQLQQPAQQQPQPPAHASTNTTPPVFFNQSINNQLASLQACTQSLELANATLGTSVNTLRQATADFPRLATVLANKKHFDLVAEQEILTAKENLAAEIGPQLQELIRRSEAAVEKEERKARTLKAKAQQAQAEYERTQARSTGTSSAPAIVPSVFRPPPTLSTEASNSLPDITEAQLIQLRAQAEAVRKRKAMLEERASQLEAEANILARW